jgi:hypothetical protein
MQINLSVSARLPRRWSTGSHRVAALARRSDAGSIEGSAYGRCEGLTAEIIAATCRAALSGGQRQVHSSRTDVGPRLALGCGQEARPAVPGMYWRLSLTGRLAAAGSQLRYATVA